MVAPEEAAFATESMSAGLSTLFLHDSSDIIVDSQLGSQGLHFSATLCRVVLRLKMLNYLGYASWQRDTWNRHQSQSMLISRFYVFLFGLTFKHFRTALLIPWWRCHHKSAHWSLWSGVSTILSIQWCENRCLNVVQFIRGISDVVLYAFQSSRIFKRMPLRFVTQGCQKWNLPCRNLFRFKPDHMVSLSQLGTAMPCFFKVKVWAGVELQGGEGWSQGVSLLRCF